MGKYILLVLSICILKGYNSPVSGHILPSDVFYQPDTTKTDSLIKNFEVKYNNLIKTVIDSVSKKKDDCDFSDWTKPLEKKYRESNDEFEKVMFGYKLAGNYLIHYDSSKKAEYKQKAEPLFCSFLSFQNGNLASEYMKLDLPKVLFMQKNWNNFTDKEKETLLFYGLLGGFNHGLPDVLKNMK